MDPTGAWLLAANQGSDNIVVFSVNPATGQLTPTGQSVQSPSPVCLIFSRA
ncbi:MAG: beta-propeller fold lactonase family protein [Thermomicrobiales bacterium]